MTKSEVMKALEAAGTEQNRKVCRNHGIQGKLFGVSYSNLGKLQRKIKTDQRLAEQLWASGNHDARVLATLIADPAAIRVATLDAWARDVDNRGLAAQLSNVAAATPSARTRMERWTTSRREMVACTGWHTLASLAREDDGLSDAYLEACLARIETTVHESPNWVKHAMNNALINIGVRNARLEKRATATARRIGKIDVDHGKTSCKTPDAAAYIKKTLTHRRKRKKRR